MTEALTSPSTFPTASCESCGKTVLTYLAFSEAGEANRCCVNCDRPISSALAWLSADELSAQGYEIGTPRARSGGGCGSGGHCGRSTQRH